MSPPITPEQLARLPPALQAMVRALIDHYERHRSLGVSIGGGQENATQFIVAAEQRASARQTNC